MPFNTSEIFIDTSAFVAWLFERDAHHREAVQRFEWVKNNHLMPITSSYIVDETATVLSHREGQMLARKFLDIVPAIHTIFITEEIQQHVHTLFRAQEMRGTSIADCSNIVLMKRLSIPTLFTYDSDFEDQFHIQVVK